MSSFPIILAYPEALLLGVALAYLYWKFVKHKNFWRTSMVVVAILVLCYPSLRLSTSSLDLLLLVDRSRSIAPEARAKQQELLELAARNLESGDRLGIISFNDKAYIEQAPSEENAALKSFQIPYSEDASDLAEGLATALSLASETRQTKVVLLSDGQYTGQDPLREAQAARQRGIPLYYRDLKRQELFNLFVSDVETPDKILVNEPFRMLFRVNSTADTPGRYRILRENQVVNEAQNQGWVPYQFSAGENRIYFTDSVRNPRIYSYRIQVQTVPQEREQVTTDNEAEKFVEVVGERPVLLVNNTGQPDNVSQVLTAGALPVHLASIGNFRMTLNQMSGYKGIILNNVAITKMTKTQIDALRDFVNQEGGGLLVCGGNNSFAAGGYYRSALEDVLPVALEDRKQAKKVSTAFSIIIDRSGSMTATVPTGETKIQLANQAAIESLNLLTGADSLSVIPTDTAPHIFVPQQPVVDPQSLAREISRIESMGGGIYVYSGLVAAGQQLLNATQLNKHILLFSDAADSEEPGSYKVLLEQFKDAGITVSVVALGTEQDQHADFLKDVAARGNGNIYFTQDATQLIQFFTADTITYARKSFIEEPAPMKVRAAAYTLSPDQKWQDFTAGGYNLMFPREKADIAIITADGDAAPILAFWQRGLGRSAAIALDCDQEFTRVPDYPDIILNTVRWVMGSSVFDSFQVRAETEGTFARIRMEVGEEERQKMADAKLLVFTPSGQVIERPMQWDTHNELGAGFRMNEVGAYRGVVKVGDQSYRIGPVSMPVSPEFAYARGAGAGREVLQQLASITGGLEVLDVRNLFERITRSAGITPLLTPLLILLLLLLIADVAEARFGMLAALKNRLRKRKSVAGKPAVSGAGTASPSETQSSGAVGFNLRARLMNRGKLKPTQTATAAGAKVATSGATAEAQATSTGAASTAEAKKPAEDMDYLSVAKDRARRATKDKK